MIPKRIARVWFDEPERPEFDAWRERLAELHPSWKITTWGSSAEVRDLITDPRLLAEWDRYMVEDPFGRVPDIARYILLWHFGGVYLDTDFEPLRPFDELLDDPRPFAAWENDRTLCTAVLASPPKHPAIGILLDGLVDRLEASRSRPANEAVGPEYATAHWRERDDVRRLPPWTFFPLGWWERDLLGQIEYPERTYAVHHWAKGWDPKANRAAPKAANLSLLVAFRDVDGARTELWDFIRARLERELPEAEIVVASDDGEDPFWKTLALNRAAEEATGDVFVVWDADTWVQADAVKQAAAFVAEHPDRWARPWTTKLKLNEEATRHVLGLDRWDGTVDQRAFGRPESLNTFQHAPPMMLTREQWETVGGFDVRFRGWGQEDLAFALTLNSLVGRQMPFRSVAIHLHHPRIGRSGADLWRGQESTRANQLLVQEYRRARNPQDMRELVRRRIEDLREAVSV